MGRLSDKANTGGRLSNQINQPNEEGLFSGTPTRVKNYIPRVGETAFELGKGAIKGALSTLDSLSGIGQRIASPLTGQKEVSKLGINTKASNPAQQIGKGIEQVGEFFVPLGGAAKGEKLLTTVLPKASKVAKFTARTVAEATEFAAKTAAQTGGDVKQTTGTFLLSLAIPPAIKGIGAVSQKIGTALPERLASVIFKTAGDDLRVAYQSLAKGKQINPTLAREVVDRNFKGNSRNMAIYAFNKLDDFEKLVQTQVKQSNKSLVVGNKATYQRFLQEVADTFKGGFYSTRAREANSLLKELVQGDSRRINMKTALKLRRFIDKMRNTSSFRLNPNLSARQEEFKYAANSLRKKLADAGLGDLMNEERIYIEAIDSIIEDAIKRSNKNVIGLVDLLAGGGGLVAGGGLTGLTAAVGIRAFQSPFTLTNLAHGIDVLTKKTSGLSNYLNKGVIGGAQQIKAGQSGIPMQQ